MSRYPTPLPLLDTLEYIRDQRLSKPSLSFAQKDFKIVKNFLLQYRSNKPTFEVYRRELERLLQWSWIVRKKSLLQLNREDIENYLTFCMKPPKNWIGTKRVVRFITKAEKRMPNPAWRLFLIPKKVSKKTENEVFKLSQETIASIFTAVGSFYNFLMEENILLTNPISQIKQKSKYFKKQQMQRKVRRLSELQWDFVIETAEMMAEEKPKRHERTLFIISALYLMYLRISELVATDRWEPQMGHFYQDSYGNWWFKTVSKGNKERDITVCHDMLKALKRYRKNRDLSPFLPLPNEKTPLIHKIIGNGPVTSDRQVRFVVEECFKRTIQRLRQDGFQDEAKALKAATVHWLRHTGISDDINKRGRPIAHVRDDAGHSSSAITDRYNDITLLERHRSAKNKKIKI